MKAKVLIVFITALTLAACSKDVFTTSPQLTFQTVNANVIPYGALLSFQFQATDKQGDIQDSMWVQRISFIPACMVTDSVPLPFQMPQFTGSSDLSAQITVAFANASGESAAPLPPCTDPTGSFQENDSCYFRFWIKDNAGNVSDTAVSPIISIWNH